MHRTIRENYATLTLPVVLSSVHCNPQDVIIHFVTSLSNAKLKLSEAPPQNVITLVERKLISGRSASPCFFIATEHLSGGLGRQGWLQLSTAMHAPLILLTLQLQFLVLA